MDKKQQKKLDKQLQKAIIKQDLDAVKAAIIDGSDTDSIVRKGSYFFIDGRVKTLENSSNRVYSSPSFNNIIGLTLRYGTPEILKCILDDGADPNVSVNMSGSGCNRYFHAPICYSIFKKEKDFVRAFLENSEVKISDGIIDFAKENSSTEIFKILKRYQVPFKVNEKKNRIKALQQELKDEENYLSKSMGINADDILSDKSRSKEKVENVVSKFPQTFKPGMKNG